MTHKLNMLVSTKRTKAQRNAKDKIHQWSCIYLYKDTVYSIKCIPGSTLAMGKSNENITRKVSVSQQTEGFLLFPKEKFKDLMANVKQSHFLRENSSVEDLRPVFRLRLLTNPNCE
ncbi:hypothetical protein Trydic_g16076 [Trypoxylus dichotomus]